MTTPPAPQGLSLQGTQGPRKASLLLSAAIALQWLAILGPAWAYVPATANTPAVNLNFSDLVALSATAPGTIGAAFYQWIAWVFAICTSIAAVAAIRRPLKTVGAVCFLVGIVQLSVTAYVSSKAMTSLSAALDGLANTRLGTVLFFAAPVLLIVAGVNIYRRPIPAVNRAPNRLSTALV